MMQQLLQQFTTTQLLMLCAGVVLMAMVICAAIVRMRHAASDRKAFCHEGSLSDFARKGTEDEH